MLAELRAHGGPCGAGKAAPGAWAEAGGQHGAGSTQGNGTPALADPQQMGHVCKLAVPHPGPVLMSTHGKGQEQGRVWHSASWGKDLCGATRCPVARFCHLSAGSLELISTAANHSNAAIRKMVSVGIPRRCLRNQQFRAGQAQGGRSIISMHTHPPAPRKTEALLRAIQACPLLA